MQVTTWFLTGAVRLGCTSIRALRTEMTSCIHGGLRLKIIHSRYCVVLAADLAQQLTADCTFSLLLLTQ